MTPEQLAEQREANARQMDANARQIALNIANQRAAPSDTTEDVLAAAQKLYEFAKAAEAPAK